MRIVFTLNGDPVGWQRTGYNGRTGAKFTQKRTRQREADIAWAYKRAGGSLQPSTDDFIRISVLAVYPIPQSASKAKKTAMVRGDVLPTVKPDVDNVLKLIMDALNGVAYLDDKQVVDARCAKMYADNPCTIVSLETVSNKDDILGIGGISWGVDLNT